MAARSLVPRDLGSGDPVQERERRGDDRERGDESAQYGRPVHGPRNPERDVELGAEEERGRDQADRDREHGDEKERHSTLQRDDAAQEAGGDPSEPEQAERALALAQPWSCSRQGCRRR